MMAAAESIRPSRCCREGRRREPKQEKEKEKE
jgi:hypothetical protein